jgi:chromate transporter
VGLFSVGGAYGAIPLIREEVFRRGWLSDEALSYMIAVSESTPGPIMVNMATYIGSDQAGFWGSLAATAGVVLPAYLVILLIACILKNTIKHPMVQAVLQGLKPCVVGIVVATGLYMMLSNVTPLSGGSFDRPGIAITAMAGSLILLVPKFTKKKLSPIALICISAVLGILLY